MGPHLHKFIPHVFRMCSETDDDELRETCLQTLELMQQRASKEIAVYNEKMLELAFEFIKYDPNCAMEEDTDDFDAMEEDEEEDEE